MPEYITKEQVFDAILGAHTLLMGDFMRVEKAIDAIPPADVVDRAELCAKLMGEFNVVDFDENTGKCILIDRYVSIIDVLDTIDGMRAEGAESIWGENGGDQQCK